MVLALRSKEHSVHFIEDQMEWSNEMWWIQHKVMMPTDMKHAHRYSNHLIIRRKNLHHAVCWDGAKEWVSRASDVNKLSGDCLTTGKFGNANKYTETFGHP